MKNFTKILVPLDSTIRNAMNVIDQGAMKLAVVIDEQGKVIGTITDGDIRRGLLRGVQLEESIDGVICRTPTLCKSTDTKETIIQTAIAKRLYQIPIVDGEGILVGVEEIDELIKSPEKKNKVVIMAGGLGTRLGDLTKTTPKPMLHVGKKPILETIITNFSKYGYRDFILTVHHLSDKIVEHFGDGSKFGVSIEYVYEKERLGTAGILGNLRGKILEPFFVMNGDILTNVNFDHLHDFHLSNSADATMCVREYEYQVPFGVVEVVDGRIVAITEKPLQKFLVSGGIYMLSHKILNLIHPNDPLDMPTLFQRIIETGGKAASFPIHEYWLDIGRVSDYEKANDEFDRIF